MDERDKRIRRLRYQSWHRGCKETDALLGNYFDRHASDLTSQQLDLYETLLEEDDWDIWQWVAYETAPPNQHFMPIIKELRRFHEFSQF